MFLNLFFSTLPLFALVFIGYSLGKFSLFNNTEAKVFSKLVAIVVVPAFGIKIIGNFNYEFINWKLYFSYLLAQGIIYFIGFIIAKKVFNRENEFRYIGEELGYTQGVGLSYQVDFQTFRDLIFKLMQKNK